VKRVRYPIVNAMNTAAQMAIMIAASSVREAARKNEAMYSMVGRHRTVWFGSRPSFE
jgi:hypothetical protein